MNTPIRIAAFAAGFSAVFAAAVGVGAAVGPVGDGTAGRTHAGSAGADGAAADADESDSLPGGLSASQSGYLLELSQSTLAPGRPADFGFTVRAADGSALQSYTTSHDKELHLIVARRDLGTFQHVHPSRDATGRWSVPLTLAEPGPYKVFADFVPAGRDRAVILAADVTVPGAYQPQAAVAPTRTAVVDDYTVTLTGDLVPGSASKLQLSVAKGGRPVNDLEPYLAAYGHLVALRASDLAYLHVHAEGEPGDGRTLPGPDMTFYAEVPTSGDYRLFLDFRHDGVVRTAAFSVHAADPRSEADHGSDAP